MRKALYVIASLIIGIIFCLKHGLFFSGVDSVDRKEGVEYFIQG